MFLPWGLFVNLDEAAKKLIIIYDIVVEPGGPKGECKVQK